MPNLLSANYEPLKYRVGAGCTDGGNEGTHSFRVGNLKAGVAEAAGRQKKMQWKLRKRRKGIVGGKNEAAGGFIQESFDCNRRCVDVRRYRWRQFRSGTSQQ
jgi:hypothetical protein